MNRDATGVVLYPRDTTGYIVFDCYHTYRSARQVLDYLARTQPSHVDEYAAIARWLNDQHVRRLLRQHTFHSPQIKRELGWVTANMPRRERRLWQRAEKSLSKWRGSFACSTEYLEKMEQLGRPSKLRNLILPFSNPQ